MNLGEPHCILAGSARCILLIGELHLISSLRKPKPPILRRVDEIDRLHRLITERAMPRSIVTDGAEHRAAFAVSSLDNHGTTVAGIAAALINNGPSPLGFGS